MPALFLSVLTVLTLLAGCDVNKRNDSLPPNELLKVQTGAPAVPRNVLRQLGVSEDWTLNWRESLGQHALRSIEIDGKCGFAKQVFRIGTPAKTEDRKTGKLSRDICNSLRRLISADDFGSLSAEYRSVIQDGYAVRINLRVGAEYYEIYCSGYFPMPIREIAALLRDIEKNE